MNIKIHFDEDLLMKNARKMFARLCAVMLVWVVVLGVAPYNVSAEPDSVYYGIELWASDGDNYIAGAEFAVYRDGIKVETISAYEFGEDWTL